MRTVRFSSVATLFVLSASAASAQIPRGDSATYLHSKAALRLYATAAMDRTLQMLRALSDADMMQDITQFGIKMPRYRALMELLDHFPWTLGQTVPYLRLNRVTPPEYSPF